MCERVRDPTAPNKILLRKILYKPNKYYVTSNQEKIKYGKILWFLSKEEKKKKKGKKNKLFFFLVNQIITAFNSYPEGFNVYM